MKIKKPKSKQPIPKYAKKVFKGVIFDVYQWEQKMFDGSKAIFEKIKRPDTVIIIPVLSDGKIILIEEQQPNSKKVIGVLSGRVEEGENILNAVKRELLEESGYKAGKIIFWSAQQPVNKLDWIIYIFIAKDLKKIAKQNLDAGEKITLKPVSFNKFLKIGSNKNFIEKELIFDLLEAKLDSRKKRKLKKLFNPN